MMNSRIGLKSGWIFALLHRGALGAILLVLGVCPGCNLGDEETDVGGRIAGSGANVTVVPGQDPACPRADLLSIQPASSSGSFLSVQIVLTDCDGSLRASGLGFEVGFDNSVLNFIGCSEGSFFPKSQLAPGTPSCTESGGRVLGTLGLTPPNSVVMGGNGQDDIIGLSFAVLQNGVSTPLSFQSTDVDTGTSLWFIDNTPTVIFHVLGGGGYAGATITIN